MNENNTLKTLSRGKRVAKKLIMDTVDPDSMNTQKVENYVGPV